MTECNQTELPFGAHFSRPTEKSELGLTKALKTNTQSHFCSICDEHWQEDGQEDFSMRLYFRRSVEPQSIDVAANLVYQNEDVFVRKVTKTAKRPVLVRGIRRSAGERF
jgi:hypothetical protein